MRWPAERDDLELPLFDDDLGSQGDLSQQSYEQRKRAEQEER
jgi:hypothetical protein